MLRFSGEGYKASSHDLLIPAFCIEIDTATSTDGLDKAIPTRISSSNITFFGTDAHIPRTIFTVHVINGILIGCFIKPNKDRGSETSCRRQFFLNIGSIFLPPHIIIVIPCIQPTRTSRFTRKSCTTKRSFFPDLRFRFSSNYWLPHHINDIPRHVPESVSHTPSRPAAARFSS